MRLLIKVLIVSISVRLDSRLVYVDYIDSTVVLPVLSRDAMLDVLNCRHIFIYSAKADDRPHRCERHLSYKIKRNEIR